MSSIVAATSGTCCRSKGARIEFTSEKFDRAFSEYDLFRLVEQPGLLLLRVPTGHRLTHSRNTPNNQFHLNSRRSRHASVRKPYPLDQPRNRQGPVVRLVRARPKPPPSLGNPTLTASVNAAEFVKVVVVPRSATL